MKLEEMLGNQDGWGGFCQPLPRACQVSLTHRGAPRTHHPPSNFPYLERWGKTIVKFLAKAKGGPLYQEI